MAARFGIPVAFVGAVGDDPNGAAILANLRAEGVATDDVAIVEGPSGVASIWVDGEGMNRIIVVPGANGLVPPNAAAAAVTRLRPAVVVGQLETPQATTAAAFAAARPSGRSRSSIRLRAPRSIPPSCARPTGSCPTRRSSSRSAAAPCTVQDAPRA